MWRSVLLAMTLLWCAGSPARSAFKNSYYSFVAGLLALQQQNYPAAVSYLMYTIREDPDAGEAYRALVTLGVQGGDVALIERYADAALEYIASPQLLTQAASVLLLGGHPDTAQRFLERAVAIDPDNREAVRLLGQIYLSSEPARATALYDRYLPNNPDDVDALFQAGVAHYQAGDPAAAAQTFQEVLKRHPSHQNARRALGELLFATTRHAEAEQLYRDYLTDHPDDTDTIARLVVLLLTTGAVTEARSYVERLERLPRPRFTPELAYLVAAYYEQIRDYRTAIRYLERSALIGRQQTPWVYLRLASYHLILKEYPRAERILHRALKLFDSPDARHMLASLYLDTNRFRKARDVLLVMEQKGGSSERTDMLLAHCYDRLGDFPAAEQRLLRILERDPDDHEALNYLGYSYADRNINLDRAEQMIGRALELQPENPAYLDSMGWLLYRRGRFREAEEYLLRAAEKLDDAVILEHLGDVRVELGRWEQAHEAYRRAQALDPRNRTLRRKIKRLAGRR